MSVEGLYPINQNTTANSFGVSSNTLNRCICCGKDTTVICFKNACLNCHNARLCHD